MPQIAKPKAIVIGQKSIADVIAGLRPEWTFLPSSPTLNDFTLGLENGTIDNDIQIVFVFDNLFSRNGNDTTFEDLLAAFAPYALICIVSFTPENRDLISSRIQDAFNRMEGGSTGPYYFIDSSRPNQTIDTAVSRYLEEATADPHVVAVLRGKEQPQSQPQAIGTEPANHVETQYQRPQGNGKIVAVTSSKGGSGKSTIAVLLAAYLARASRNSVKEGLENKPLKVVIVDLDVRDGQLGFLTGNTKPTILSLKHSGVTQANVENTKISDDRLMCDLLLAPKRPRHADDIPAEFYIELLQQLRVDYDYIILDTSVNYLDPLLEKVAYPMADQIIFVSDIVVNSIFSMTRWIQEVTSPRDKGGMGINPAKVGIVVNKFISDVNMNPDKIKKAAQGIVMLTVVPSNPKLIAHAANRQAMDTLLKHVELNSSISRLAKSVTGRKYNLSNTID